MLQFFDRIVSKKGFVDMHIHTNDSYGEEMNQMNFTPEELLDSVKMYADNNYCDATFALTDHNSIEGVQKIMQKMKENPEDYKNINYISGCEFTCSAGSLGTVVNGEGHKKNLIKNFHMLAYGFDPYDKDLNFLCRLYSTRRENSVVLSTKHGYLKVPAGFYAMSLRTILNDYGLNLSLKDISDINLTTNNMDSRDYVRYLMTYVEKYNLSEEVKNDIRTQLYNRNVDQLGKPDCMEVMEIVENAGGYCVLAHPTNLKESSAYKNNKNRAINDLKAELDRAGVHYDGNESLKKLIIRYVIHSMSNEARSLTTGEKLNGIVGVEALHSSATFRTAALDHIIECAKENNLYLTVGGDSHGDLLNSCCLSKFMPQECNSSRDKNEIVVTDCLFAERLIDGSIKDNLHCYSDFDEQMTISQTVHNHELEIKLDDLKEMIEGTYTSADCYAF